MDKQFLESHGVVQLPNETAKAFFAFQTYLQSPPERRSYRGLTAQGFKFGSVVSWSQKHNWQDRARAFDASVTEAGLDQLLGARVSVLVESILDSLADVKLFREELLKQLPGASSTKLRELVSARVEIEAWNTQILELLASMEDRVHGPS